MEDSKKWLEQAVKDLDTAKYNLQGGRKEAGIFFLQQAAEKALKAAYIKKFRKLFKIHDLVLLSKRIKAPQKILEYCKELSPAYQYTRYPDVTPVRNLDDLSKKFINYVEEILKWVKKII